ncbi:hypothetical protein J5N97_008625 [Dioscorea zingiberensis]|uniref:Uncharacterized protein n=1 Tax=Dioscorea zingiberensis TaxID=325984 RepID=A0A9D5HKS2_9LILI|nr:hypothetical protein J5N97_008625 [Dioscorea zingiberensis]
MLRPTASRNQRARGFRVKHGLQIFLLIAICIWLLYQVKHSHDKKRAMEESNSKGSIKVGEIQEERFNFGRKVLPRAGQAESTSETQAEEEKEETEEEDEQEPKQEEAMEEDERGVGDDSIDEKDQYRGDEEAEEGEESGHEEEKDGKEEEMDESYNLRDFQEAREENYRRDDVAGSVHQETQTTYSESGDDESIESTDRKEEETENFTDETVNVVKNNNTSVDNSKGNVSDVGMTENKSMSTANNNQGVGMMTEKETMTTENQFPNVTAVEKKESEDEGHSNSTTDELLNNQIEMKNNLTTSTESRNQINDTINVSKDQTETQNNSAQDDAVTHDVPRQNETAETQNATDKMEPFKDNNSDAENVTAEQAEKANNTSSSIENDDGHDATEGEFNNSSVHAVTDEEKDARTDLSTLADSVGQTVGNGFDDEAVE